MRARYTPLIIAALLAVRASPLLAQAPPATATGTANATVIKSLSLRWDDALNFGTFIQPTADAQLTMELTSLTSVTSSSPITLGPVVTSGTLGLLNTPQTIHNTGDPPGPAIFEAHGEPGCYFTITLPTQSIPLAPSITLYGGGDPPQMYMTDFKAFVGAGIGLTGQLDPTGGFSFFAVGATLHVNANQPTGWYSGDFPVTVAYN